MDCFGIQWLTQIRTQPKFYYCYRAPHSTAFSPVLSLSSIIPSSRLFSLSLSRPLQKALPSLLHAGRVGVATVDKEQGDYNLHDGNDNSQVIFSNSLTLFFVCHWGLCRYSGGCFLPNNSEGCAGRVGFALSPQFELHCWPPTSSICVSQRVKRERERFCVRQ